MVITGSSGSGKTTLLRTLAQLWPVTEGRWSTPAGGDRTMFLSQLPYLPLGDVRAVVSCPACPGDFDDQRLRDVLTQVSLAHLRNRLCEEQDWAKVLSPGEQQRVAFARVILHRPDAVFLDEATSAVEEDLEFALYELLRTELPDTIVVSVGHHGAVEQHHGKHLTLLGGGAWRLDPIAESAVGYDRRPSRRPAYCGSTSRAREPAMMPIAPSRNAALAQKMPMTPKGAANAPTASGRLIWAIRLEVTRMPSVAP
jgi:putative ATP-binding cassette transporter